MATNVFGVPVTEGNRADRAREAMNYQNAGGKRDEAIACVRRMKENWGSGASTLGIFYNATGETLSYVQANSPYGQINSSYPLAVQNGQWGVFFHVRTAIVPSGSSGFVMYRVEETHRYNSLIAWSIPWDQVKYNNQAYCDIFEDGKVDTPNDVYTNMKAINSTQHVVTRFGLMITAKIGPETSPLFEAVFTLKDVAIREKNPDQQDVVEASPSA